MRAFILQVISAHVRTNLLEGHGIVPDSGSEAADRKGEYKSSHSIQQSIIYTIPVPKILDHRSDTGFL